MGLIRFIAGFKNLEMKKFLALNGTKMGSRYLNVSQSVGFMRGGWCYARGCLENAPYMKDSFWVLFRA